MPEIGSMLRWCGEWGLRACGILYPVPERLVAIMSKRLQRDGAAHRRLLLLRTDAGPGRNRLPLGGFAADQFVKKAGVATDELQP